MEVLVEESVWEFSGKFSDDRAIFGEFWKFKKLFYYFYLFSEIRFSVVRSGPLVFSTLDLDR